MTRIPASPAPASFPSPQERLKQTALQLEGVFVRQLFAAMRDTVPDDGILSQSSAEGTFKQMLDEKFSEQVPTQWNGRHSLAEALYRQLSQRLALSDVDSTGSDPK